MRQRRRHVYRLAGIALLAGAMLAGGHPAWAQKSNSSIEGTVTDQSGPVPGAQIEAIAEDTGFRVTATADGQGHFVLAGLAPGVYTVNVSAEGQAPQSQKVEVLVAQSVHQDFQLEPGKEFGESVTVEAPPLLLRETRTSEVATNVTRQQIENLPQNNRNFLAFAALAPGVRFTTDQDAAGQKFRSGGEDSRQVNVFIDGLSYKNDLLQGGAFNQDSSRGNPFPQNAVQEFRVLTQNYKAEYEKASAAVITAVTKSGSNQVKGDAFFLFQDKGLVSQDDFSKDRGEEKPDYKRNQGGFSLGGPIVKDTLNYFLSYERQTQDRNATVFRGSDFANAPADVQQFLGQFPTGVLTQPFDSDLYFGKLSWQPAEGQSAYLTYYRRKEHEVRGFGGQRTRDGAESFEIGNNAWVAHHTWVLGDALNDASVTYQTLEWNPTALNSTEPRLNYVGILDVGGKDATQDFKQDKIGVRDDLSYFADWHGTHTLKAGASVNWLDYTITKRLVPNGTFTFRSDESWEFPFMAQIGFGDPGLSFNNKEVGLYLQDDWAPTSRLTFNLGVRWDYESNMINNDYVTPPDVVAALEGACRTYDQPVGGRTDWCLRDFFPIDQYTSDGNDRPAYYGMIQPRFGFAWSLGENADTVVFGGWGKYYDRVILNDIFDEAYRQQWKVYSFCFSADGGPAPNCSVPALQWQDSFLSADALRQLIASGQAPGPEIFLVNDHLKPPRSDQWTLGVRHTFGKWLGSLSYVGVRSYNGLIYFFADLPPGTAFGDRFGGNVPVPGHARVFYTSTARKTWYDGALLSLDRPMAAGGRWGFHLAYTYAKAWQNGTDNPGEGVAFGAFDYASSADLYKFPGTNDERHHIVASGTVRLPARFQLSSLITLGSGTPFTIFDDSTAPFTVRWNEGRPDKQDFIIPNAFAYRSVDLRLEWQAPPIKDVAVSLIGEGFNVFNFDNFGCFDNFKPRLPAVNDHFGQPNCEFNTRRFQVGARVSF